jgi:hypothetical protein
MKTSTYENESLAGAVDTSDNVRVRYRVRDRAPGVYKEVKTVVCGVSVRLRMRGDNRIAIEINRGNPRFFSQDEAFNFLGGLKTLVNETFKADY